MIANSNSSPWTLSNPTTLTLLIAVYLAGLSVIIAISLDSLDNFSTILGTSSELLINFSPPNVSVVSKY